MATQFEIDCALMAGAAYRSTRSENNRIPSPTGSGWEELPSSYRNIESSGFEAVSYHRGDEIVISFAGTYDSDDIEADMALALGTYSLQLQEAAEYYLQVRAENPDAQITLTGHSLGGGLASLIAVFFDEEAITFDQAPFRAAAESDIQFPNLILPSLLAELQSNGGNRDALSL